MVHEYVRRRSSCDVVMLKFVGPYMSTIVEHINREDIDERGNREY